jgi:hypothetical protein
MNDPSPFGKNFKIISFPADTRIIPKNSQQTFSLKIPFKGGKKMIGKKLLSALIGITLTVAVTGCPTIYKITLQGSWEVDEYYKNGDEDTQAFNLAFGDYVIKFHPDGDFTETYKAMNIVPITNPGTWDIISNGQQLQLQLVDKGATRTFDILGVTNEELRLYRELGEGGNEELVLEPKEEL